MTARISYDEELSNLPESYERIKGWDGEEFRSTLLAAASGPAVFVGTGGTLAVARLAAYLHEQIGGQPARAMTPLELSRLSPMTRASAVLFSAGLRHPDAVVALKLLDSGRLRPAAVVTLRDPIEVRPLSNSDVRILGLPPLPFREGFLATSSVLYMFSALLRAYLGDESLPKNLPAPPFELPTDQRHLLVLSSPDLAPVATDIETRCHELGTASVQLSDFRNFAHGRHVGLWRNSSTTRVLALAAQPFRDLAEATLRVLPKDQIQITTWGTERAGAEATLELLVASMHLSGALARSQGIEAARPHVAPFGRRLYHLGLSRAIPKIADGPVERKLVALSAGSTSGQERSIYEHGLEEWIAAVSDTRFGGLVMDYDGTICATGRRTEIPEPDIQAYLLRLLDGGLLIGVASGRGKSLHSDFRKWVPERHWDRIVLSFYNGGVTLRLSDEIPDLSRPTPIMEDVAERLKQLPNAGSLSVETRTHQVTVTVRPGGFAHPSRLRLLVSAAVAQSPPLPVVAIASAHSVDIVPTTSSKRDLHDQLLQAGDRPLLTIGDQGDIGGNDFDLLAATPWSLTVDRCSPDPTRCWYLDRSGLSGPSVLASYLKMMRVRRGAFELRVPDL